MPLTNYPIYQAKGGPGLCPNDSPKRIRGTQGEFANGTSGLLPFGLCVAYGSSANYGKLGLLTGTTTIENLAGVTVYTNVYEKTDGKSGYPPGRPVAVLVEGEIYVIAETNVSVSSKVSIRIGNETSPTTHAQIGRFLDKGGAVANRELRLPKCKFLETAAAGELVRIYVDFT